MTRSVDRALALLEALEASSQEGASLMELVERTGVDKSTVTRLLSTCVDRAWIVRDPASRRYSLGPTLLAMARRGALDDRVMITVYEALTGVRDATGETAGFHRRAGDRRVAIAGVESRHDGPVHRSSWSSPPSPPALDVRAASTAQPARPIF